MKSCIDLVGKLTLNSVLVCLILPPTAKNLLSCLLKMDPAYRMSASQILETPWITVRHRFVSGCCAHPTLPKESHRQLLTERFVQQGDTNIPLPSNVLEMMRNYVEESASKTTAPFCV